METTEASINIRVDKEDVIHLCNGLLVSQKREQSNAAGSNMDRPRGDHTKQSQSGREKQVPYEITCVWNLKHDMETGSQTQRTDSWLPRGKWGWGGLS